MEFKLSTYLNGNIIYKNSYPDNFDGDRDIDEIKTVLRTENTILKVKEKWFNGIHISIVEIDPDQAEDFLFESSHHHIGFLFCLDGTIHYCCDQLQHNRLSLSKNEQNINVGKINAIKFSAKEKTRFVYIQLTESYFYKIAGREFSNITLANQQESITSEISLILQHLVNHNHEGRVKRLFLEARIFELIIIYMNQKQEKQTVSLKQEDVNKIMLAKQLVEQDLQKPNSLMELSRKAGINDYKLKKGFKEITGHTVFGYLYKIRMEKAHYFLAKEKRTVNEVAFLVGYKNAQHFISAFKKKYHILPGSLNKN
jgi:AraC-like DNA-binding protein